MDDPVRRESAESVANVSPCRAAAERPGARRVAPLNSAAMPEAWVQSVRQVSNPTADAMAQDELESARPGLPTPTALLV